MRNCIILLLVLAVSLSTAIALANEPSHVQERAIRNCLNCEGELCGRVSAQNRSVTCSADCVAIFSGFTLVKRACYSRLSESEKAHCDSNSQYTCYKCQEDRCNQLGRVDHKCLTCSSASDENCLHVPSAVAQNRCRATTTDDVQCYVKVVNGTSTERGCITTQREIRDCENDSGHCSLCAVGKDGACNTYDYPAARRRCIECRGGHNCTALLDTAITVERAPGYCENPSDACIAIDNCGKYTLACAATLTANERQFCAENAQSCATCSANNCNRSLPPAPESCSSAATVVYRAFLIVLGCILLIL